MNKPDYHVHLASIEYMFYAAACQPVV